MIRDFIPDDFQVESITLLEEGYDVIVSAPTGAGKTYIAEVFSEKIINRGGKVWYATPLKALSNDKYRDFQELFGCENCGILTGDRKENPNSPLIVGTTEILRNMLVDTPESVDIDLIVLDEAQWISDPERGVSWEEIIIFAPKKTQFLILSATIPNAEDVRKWISSVREKEKIKVVYRDERPVPLIWLSLGNNNDKKFLQPLFNKNGKLKIRSDKIFRNRYGDIDWNKIVDILKDEELTPSIFFFSSRVKCEKAAECITKHDPRHYIQRVELFDKFAKTYPYLKEISFVERFVETGIGPHHAGLLPAVKIFFEEGLKKGIATALFATRTLSSGIDVPAKSCVIIELEIFDGISVRRITSSELAQMAGRAGRRGKDEKGFAILFSPITQNLETLFGKQEKVESSFYVTPYLTLSLLRTHSPEKALEIAKKSLRTYEESPLYPQWLSLRNEAEREYFDFLKKFEDIKVDIECTPETRKNPLKRKRQCSKCPKHEECKKFLKKLYSLESKIKWLKGNEPDSVKKEFEGMINFLIKLGYVDEEFCLTEKGWDAQKIKHPRSVYIFESLERGIIQKIPEKFASGISVLLSEAKPPFVNPPEHIEKFVRKIYNIEKSFVLTPKFRLSRNNHLLDGKIYNAVNMWARNEKFEKVTMINRIQEGDFVRMVLQTVEALRQIRDIKKYEDISKEAISLVFRSPITDVL